VSWAFVGSRLVRRQFPGFGSCLTQHIVSVLSALRELGTARNRGPDPPLGGLETGKGAALQIPGATLHTLHGLKDPGARAARRLTSSGSLIKRERRVRGSDGRSSISSLRGWRLAPPGGQRRSERWGLVRASAKTGAATFLDLPALQPFARTGRNISFQNAFTVHYQKSRTTDVLGTE